MTKANDFTPEMECKIHDVGRKIEQARLALRLSLREAASRTVTARSGKSITEFTWRRAERATIQTGIGEITYRPTADTLAAICEVVGLDPEVICKEVGLVAPPRREPVDRREAEMSAVRKILRDALGRLEKLEKLEVDR